MFNGIWLAVLGILGASSLIISRRPDAAQMIAKLAPYQGWIGAVSALWGVWGVISCVLSIAWMTSYPIFWFTWVADSVLQVALVGGRIARLLGQDRGGVVDLELRPQDQHRDQPLALGRLLLEDLGECTRRDQLLADQVLANGERFGQGRVNILDAVDIG